MNKQEEITLRIKILEVYDKLVADGIWNEKIYLDEVNMIKNIKIKDLKDILWYLETQDDY
tara:strand:+ start:384 stop:563 length:180 start_codon:yes stop_codon:yes gene_type:complete